MSTFPGAKRWRHLDHLKWNINHILNLKHNINKMAQKYLSIPILRYIFLFCSLCLLNHYADECANEYSSQTTLQNKPQLPVCSDPLRTWFEPGRQLLCTSETIYPNTPGIFRYISNISATAWQQHRQVCHMPFSAIWPSKQGSKERNIFGSRVPFSAVWPLHRNVNESSHLYVWF